MIVVHRLKGERMFLNADLVESVEETPDTVLTLVDGRRLVVSDRADEIAARILEFRASILVSASEMRNHTMDAATVVPLYPEPLA
jgi:flagellar protein FlbD